MNILLVLIPVTLLVVLAGLALFFWAVNHQQFEDLDSPAMLPLLDNPARDEHAEEPARGMARPPAPAPQTACDSAGGESTDMAQRQHATATRTAHDDAT